MSDPLRWFRVYAEAVDDEKLRLLAFEDRWHFIALLCCKAAGILDGEDAEMRHRKVAVKLGLDLRELSEVARRLAEVGLIEQETLSPLGWDRRQFRSDHDPTAHERLKKFREKRSLRSATDMKRVAKRTCNGHETRSETETETETETEKRGVAPNGATVSESVDSDAPPAVGGNKKPPYKVPDCPYQAIVDAYHEALPQCPRVEVLSDQRKRYIQARWKQVCADDKLDAKAGLEWFVDFFKHVAASKFLTGRVGRKDGGRPFFASLDWLMGPEKFARVYEGRYHDEKRA